MNEHYRQGDLLIEKIAAVPEGAEKQKAVNGRIVLALGEATGHDHSLEANGVDWFAQGTDQFLRLRQHTSVVHQEHAPIVLSPGIYRVQRQREYSPEAIRTVAD